jgi:pyruvate dehydrogenase E2 component (dihydrolipoamide acetyltransferase)
MSGPPRNPSGLHDVGMPRLSDSMEEATVLQWLKRPGDEVAKGEPLVEVETDKATIVYEAEAAGRLEEIVVAEGHAAALGDVIARLRIAAATGAPPPAVAAPTPAPAERAAAAPSASPPARPPKQGRARATPVARRLAKQLGVSLEGLDGSGPGGRIVRADVRGAAPGDGAAVGAPAETGRGGVTEVAHTPTQRTIAERMAESRATVPEFTLEAEIGMDAALVLRDELKAAGTDPLPSLNDLIVRAAALALREFPALNASYAPGKTLRYERVNVGIAVDVDDALLVPTIRDADRRSLFEIARESRRLAEAARARRVGPDALADGTFTVSNLGMFGVRRFHAVINAPQAAILAVGEVAERAVVADGTVVPRSTVEVALACDHRVVYGAEAARFLQRLKHLLEHPVVLVLDPKEVM